MSAMDGVPLAVPASLMAAMYMFSGLEKFPRLGKVADGLRKRVPGGGGLPRPLFVLAITVSSCMLVLASGTVVAASVARSKEAKARGMYAAWYLAAFTVAATLLYHWPPTGKAYYPFISNVTAVGGLLLLADVLGGGARPGNKDSGFHF